MEIDLLITCILSSTVAAAIITSIKEVVLWKMNRKAKVSDKSIDTKLSSMDKSIKKLTDDVKSLHERVGVSCNSNRVLLQGKIKFLALKYIEEGEITYEDRSLIHAMWNIYHYDLGGNGDLDDVMQMLDEVPLKYH